MGLGHYLGQLKKQLFLIGFIQQNYKICID